MGKITPALRNETIRVGIGTGGAVVLMWAAFAVLHHYMPDKVPFDYTVILGGLGGAACAVGNFFLMGLTVQQVTGLTDEADAKKVMQVSLRNRYLLMILWCIAAIAAPCFHFAAGILPLLFPGFVIRFLYIRAGREEAAAAAAQTGARGAEESESAESVGSGSGEDSGDASDEGADDRMNTEAEQDSDAGGEESAGDAGSGKGSDH